MWPRWPVRGGVRRNLATAPPTREPHTGAPSVFHALVGLQEPGLTHHSPPACGEQGRSWRDPGSLGGSPLVRGQESLYGFTPGSLHGDQNVSSTTSRRTGVLSSESTVSEPAEAPSLAGGPGASPQHPVGAAVSPKQVAGTESRAYLANSECPQGQYFLCFKSGRKPGQPCSFPVTRLETNAPTPRSSIWLEVTGKSLPWWDICPYMHTCRGDTE